MSFVRLVAGCGGCGDSEQDSDDILNFADCCRDLAARLPPLREAGERGGLGDVQPPPSPPPGPHPFPGVASRHGPPVPHGWLIRCGPGTRITTTQAWWRWPEFKNL